MAIPSPVGMVLDFQKQEIGKKGYTSTQYALAWAQDMKAHLLYIDKVQSTLKSLVLF